MGNMVCVQDTMVEQEKSTCFKFFTLNQVHFSNCFEHYIFNMYLTLVHILWHYRYCVCRRPQCAEGDICKKDNDCGTYFELDIGRRGTCEKTITDRSKDDLWLYTDMRWEYKSL